MPCSFDLSSFLPYRFSVLASAMSREFAKCYEYEHGISNAEWRVIAHLADHQSISVREIVSRVDLDKVRVSRAVARLNEDGFISKKTNPDDKRLVVLSLSRKGRSLYERIVPRALDFEDSLLAEFSDTDRQRLAKLLHKFEEWAEKTMNKQSGG